MKLRYFLVVTKPGIIFGNLFVTIGAYLFGAGRNPEPGALVGLFVGTGLIIASSCVFNNYIDRKIDSKMKRTAKRPSVTGVIPATVGLAYAGILLVAGAWTLATFTNLATLAIGLIGAFWYVLIYGYAKRKTPLSTLVGTVPGATPPLAGYVAATNSFDATAWALFALLVVWQMPHFYAIAIFRLKDYALAGLPVLSVVKGVQRTVWEMRVYALIFLLPIVTLFNLSRLSGAVFIIMLGFALWWLRQANHSVGNDEANWARKVFRISLLILPVFSLLWAIDPWLRSAG